MYLRISEIKHYVHKNAIKSDGETFFKEGDKEEKKKGNKHKKVALDTILANVHMRIPLPLDSGFYSKRIFSDDSTTKLISSLTSSFFFFFLTDKFRSRLES